MPDDEAPEGHKYFTNRIDELEKYLLTIHEEQLRLVMETIERHRTEDHYPISFERIGGLIEQAGEHEETMVRIVDALEGEMVVDLEGNELGRRGGLIALGLANQETLGMIEHRTNGGVTVTQKIDPQWTRSQKIAASGVGVMVALGAIPGVFTLMRGIVHLIDSL